MEAGTLELLPAPGGQSLRYRGRWLYSRHQPRAIPESLVRATEFPPRSLVLCPSPLLGYGLDQLLEKIGPDSKIIAVEADPQLMELSLANIGARILSDPRVSFRAISETHQEDLLGADSLEFRRIILLKLNGGFALNAEAYQALARSLEAEIQRRWRNKATCLRLARPWIRNLVSNLPYLADAKSLSDLFLPSGQRPIVVCGAGPSLEASLGELRRRRADFFILAVDTAISCLGQAGIKPDAIVCLEAQVHNLKDFIGVNPESSCLIADLQSHPSSFRLFKDHAYACVLSHSGPWSLIDRLKSAFPDLDILPPLGSVGLAAMYLAVKYRNPGQAIGLSGLDFAYPMAKSHARSAPPILASLNARTRLWPAAKGEVCPGRGVLPLSPGQRDAWGQRAYSNPILRAYAELARHEVLSGVDGIFDLREFGIDLDIPKLDISRLGLMRYNSATNENAEAYLGTCQDGTINTEIKRRRDSLDSFISTEAGYAERLLAHFRADLPRDGAECRALLRLVDYASAHFPDHGPIDSALADQSFLNRLSAELISYPERWARARARLSPPS